MMTDNEDSQSQAPRMRTVNATVPVWAEFINRPRLVFGVLAGSIFILMITAIYCLLSVVTIETMKHEERYDQCIDPERNRSCGTFKPGPKLPKCTCILDFEVKSLIRGKVTMYYELESFDQKNSTYANSRDNDQLMGNPGPVPAQSCGNYSYSDNKPIFPCGEVADSMFNDTFIHLKRTDREPKEIIPVLYTKLFTDATPEFKNPPPDVLNNFTTPINWRIDAAGVPFKPWESNMELKGIENPAFRAWMDTNLKRKPVWRLDDSHRDYWRGLPPGNYSIKIYMFYGVDRYSGVRKIILEGVETHYSSRNPAGGAVCMLLIVLLIILIIFVYYRYRNFAQKVPSTNDTETDAITDRTPANDDRQVPLLNRIRSTLTGFRSK